MKLKILLISLILFLFLPIRVFAGGNTGLTTDIFSQVQNGIVDDQGKPIFKPNLGTYINLIVDTTLVIGTIASLILIIWGGINWVTSGGDKGKVEEARNRITSALIGLLIIAAVWVIWILALDVLGLKNMKGLNIARTGKSCQQCIDECAIYLPRDECRFECEYLCK